MQISDVQKCSFQTHAKPSTAEDGLLASLACLSINACCLFRSILANMCGVKDTLISSEEFAASGGATWEWQASGASMISLQYQFGQIYSFIHFFHNEWISK